MRYYIATTLENHAEHNRIRDILNAAGHECTYDWTEHGSLMKFPERRAEVAQKELNGVIEADVIIVLMPGGRGTHVELGAALASRVIGAVGVPEIYLYTGGADYDKSMIFHYHPAIRRYDNVDELVINVLGDYEIEGADVTNEQRNVLTKYTVACEPVSYDSTYERRASVKADLDSYMEAIPSDYDEYDDGK